MSHAHGQARFEDGTILHFEYNGTSDVVIPNLRNSAEEVDEHWRDGSWSRCICGQPSEPVLLAASYGLEPNWKGEACRACMAVTNGFQPYDDEDGNGLRHGRPDWWKV